MAGPMQPTPQQIAGANIQNRAALLATAPRMRKNVVTQTAPIGGSSRLKLFNVGVLTNVQIDVSCAVTIGTAAAVASAKAPYNLISRIRLTDYDGTDRVNLSGFQLYVLNCIRARSLYGVNNSAAAVSSVITNPVIPTATGDGTIKFVLDIPLAFDVNNAVPQLQDLRGAIMAQTAVGEMYLNIDWNPTLYSNADVDAVYAGASTTTVVGNGTSPISVTMYQEYLLPQAIGGAGQVPLPGIDLMTVYELNGNVRSSDNLSQGSEKLISLPNVRSVIGAYVTFVDDGALSNNVSQFRLIANGNNVLKEYTGRLKQFEQRKFLGGDIASGVFFELSREKPIETALYGNVQLGITPSSITDSPYMELAWESFYTKGAALPGIGQGQ